MISHLIEKDARMINFVAIEEPHTGFSQSVNVYIGPASPVALVT